MIGTKNLIQKSGRKVAEVTHVREIPFREWAPLAHSDPYAIKEEQKANVEVDKFLDVRAAPVAGTPGGHPLAVPPAPRVRPAKLQRADTIFLNPDHRSVETEWKSLAPPPGGG